MVGGRCDGHWNADTDSAQTLVEPLTRREREILALLAAGFSAPEIAEQLTLAVSSVKWHIQHLYGKLGVNSKRQALTRAQALGLLGAATPPAPAARPRAWRRPPAQPRRDTTCPCKSPASSAARPRLPSSKSAWTRTGW